VPFQSQGLSRYHGFIHRKGQHLDKPARFGLNLLRRRAAAKTNNCGRSRNPDENEHDHHFDQSQPGVALS
jgi:hypothetical protein